MRRLWSALAPTRPDLCIKALVATGLRAALTQGGLLLTEAFTAYHDGGITRMTTSDMMVMMMILACCSVHAEQGLKFKHNARVLEPARAASAQ